MVPISGHAQFGRTILRFGYCAISFDLSMRSLHLRFLKPLIPDHEGIISLEYGGILRDDFRGCHRTFRLTPISYCKATKYPLCYSWFGKPRIACSEHRGKRTAVFRRLVPIPISSAKARSRLYSGLCSRNNGELRCHDVSNIEVVMQ